VLVAQASPELQDEVARNRAASSAALDRRRAGARQDSGDTGAIGAPGAGAIRTRVPAQSGPPELPPGVPPPNMADRHVLTNFNFFKAARTGANSGNSYLTKPIDNAELDKLYREAIATGTRDGTVKLSNGQSWYVNRTTGKFFPTEGPGIVQLSQQEVRLLETTVKQIQGGTSPEAAAQNLSRAMQGQGYKITPAMQ
jgi:hypothetical protein